MSSPTVDVTLWQGQQECWIGELGLPLEMGRHAFRLSLSSDGWLELTNLHSRSTFQIASDPNPVMPQESVVADREFTILLPENLIVKVVLCSTLADQQAAPEGGMGDPSSASFRTISPDAQLFQSLRNRRAAMSFLSPQCRVLPA